VGHFSAAVDNPAGNEPVLDVLNSLPDRKRAVIENQLDRLNMQEPDGPPLPQPWTSQIEGELREFRAHYGEEHYRVLYRRSGNLLVLLHLIRKTTRSVPKRDILTAKERWADFKRRMEAAKRTPPRAAGHDAPRRR